MTLEELQDMAFLAQDSSDIVRLVKLFAKQELNKLRETKLKGGPRSDDYSLGWCDHADSLNRRIDKSIKNLQ